MITLINLKKIKYNKLDGETFAILLSIITADTLLVMVLIFIILLMV